MVSLGNMYTNNVMWTQQFIFRNTYPHTNTNVRVITMDENRDLIEKEERILKEGKRMGTVVIKIQTQAKGVKKN